MIFNYFESEKRLLFYEHGVEEIPDEVIAEFRNKEVTHIDFSSNSLMSLQCIVYFSNLCEIILDNNFLSDQTLFPAKVFYSVSLISLNNNKFEDLSTLVENLNQTFPNLRYLSLLGNPLCPVLSSTYNEDDYQNYRLIIISKLPTLKFLDATMITTSEWSSIHSDDSLIVEKTSRKSQATMDRMSLWKRIFRTYQRDPQTAVDREYYTPLPKQEEDEPYPKSYYGKVRHHYKGTDSQGNRFIGNTML